MKRILCLMPFLINATVIAQMHYGGSTAAPDGPINNPPYIAGNHGVQQSVPPSPGPQSIGQSLSTDQQSSLLRENDRINALRRANANAVYGNQQYGQTVINHPLTGDHQQQLFQQQDRVNAIRNAWMQGTPINPRQTYNGIALPLTDDQQRQLDKEEDKAWEIRGKWAQGVPLRTARTASTPAYPPFTPDQQRQMDHEADLAYSQRGQRQQPSRVPAMNAAPVGGSTYTTTVYPQRNTPMNGVQNADPANQIIQYPRQ